MNNKKVIITIIVLVFILGIGVWLWGSKKSVTDVGKSFTTIKIPTTAPNQISTIPLSQRGIIPKQNLDESNAYVTEYDWSEVKLQTQDKIKVDEIKNPEINDQLLSRFTRFFKFLESPVVDNESMVAFSNVEDGSNFYISKYDWHANYYRDLISKPINPGDLRLSEQDLKNKMIEIINQVIVKPKNVDLVLGKVERQDLGDLMYKPSGDPNSRIVYFEMYYLINNYPVYTNIGAPISARFYDDGTLLTFSITLPFSIKGSLGEFNSKTFNEIKNIPAYKFKILAVKGGEGTEIYSEDYTGELINKLTLTKGYLGYVYQGNNEYLQPYYIFDGYGDVRGKRVDLTVGVPALMEVYYK